MADTTSCKSCNSNKIFTGIDLGNSPISNELLFDKYISVKKFELKMLICSECGLGQLSKNISSSRIFDNNVFSSSVNKDFVE
jgi:hypothetical protein